MDVYGHIRFSFFGKNDTKVGRDNLSNEERFEILYNSARMESRFYYFEKITLPSIKMQDDQDFKIFVVSSGVMPDVYKTRLMEICADIPQVEVIFSDNGTINRAFGHHIRPQFADSTERSVHFRLDDDDAISKHVVGKLRQDAERLKSSTLISYPNGYLLAEVDDRYRLIQKHEPYIAIAWALVCDAGEPVTPYGFRHGGYHRNNPSFIDPAGLHYIHNAHAFSDTTDSQPRKIKRALSHDKKFDTQEGLERDAQILADNFPCFASGTLEDIMRSAPDAPAKHNDTD